MADRWCGWCQANVAEPHNHCRNCYGLVSHADIHVRNIGSLKRSWACAEQVAPPWLDDPNSTIAHEPRVGRDADKHVVICFGTHSPTRACDWELYVQASTVEPEKWGDVPDVPEYWRVRCELCGKTFSLTDIVRHFRERHLTIRSMIVDLRNAIESDVRNMDEGMISTHAARLNDLLPMVYEVLDTYEKLTRETP